MNAPTGRRPPGPLLPEDQAGGSASGPSRGPGPVEPDPFVKGDVRAGVEAWLAGHGVTLPPERDPSAGRDPLVERDPSVEPVETTRRAAPPPQDTAALGPEADAEAVARKILLDQLTGQARSRAELTTKLARKGVPPEIGERLLDRFEEVGLVDDAAFARSWVESRQSGKGLARR
ncbi:MAG: regulatory protein RecX, partial [Nocardioidaceae bacterium]